MEGKKNLAVAESTAAALPGFFPWDNAVNEFSVKLHFLPGKCIGFLPTCVFKVVRSTSLAGEQPISSKACGATSARATRQQARPGTFTLFTTWLCPHLNTGAHNDWDRLKARLQQHHTLSDSTGRPLRFQQRFHQPRELNQNLPDDRLGAALGPPASCASIQLPSV